MKRKMTFTVLLSVTLALISFTNCINAQSNFLEKEINFLSNPPIIDGLLDNNLTILEPRYFPVINKDNDSNQDIPVSYRIAYGTEFLYIFIEAEAEKLIYRDRAFQNGDGFHMVLTKPKPDNQPTDEFYVLACSAVDRESMEWTRNIFWYYNVDHIFQRTSIDTKLMFAEQDGKISFELILPWKDIYPYHPWISDGIGFNLSFVKAIGDQHKNIYKVLDAELGNENSNRAYLNLKFQEPVHNGEPQTYFILDKNNIDNTEVLSGTATTLSSGNYEEDLLVYIMSGENNLLDSKREKYNCQKGITVNHFNINKNPIPSGGYKVKWKSENNKSGGEMYLTSIPEFNQNFYNKELEKVKEKISPSSFYTLKHQIYEVGKELEEIKPYETCGKLRITISKLRSTIENSRNGTDIIAKKTGFVRKGYKSKLDSTLQPYMVYLPDNYNPNNTYPLVIYLHGSASDETNIIGFKYLIPEGFIGLAPYARGPSNCYSWDNAQADISEAIDAVIENYSIDEDSILLTGFSMGGYGVYRSYYETPDRFKALAVFSGHPNLANQWSDDKDVYPNFTQKKYLTKFKDVPIFIFHGKEDRNCLFETTTNIIEKLENAGANVKFITEENKGHEPPDEETVKEYYKWVNTTLNNKK